MSDRFGFLCFHTNQTPDRRPPALRTAKRACRRGGLAMPGKLEAQRTARQRGAMAPYVKRSFLILVMWVGRPLDGRE